MKINWTLILKICGGLTTASAVVGMMFGVFRFVEQTRQTHKTTIEIVEKQDSVLKTVNSIYQDVLIMKQDFVIFHSDVVQEINNHEKSYKEFLMRYANLNTEQYATLTEGIKGLKDDLKKNSYRIQLQDE